MPKPKRSKREQVSRACALCRLSKAKCSSERPCRRCIRQGTTCVDIQPTAEALVIERPFRFRGGGAHFDLARCGEQEWLDQLIVDSGLQWIAGPVQRLFELGVDKHKVVRMFSTLPGSWVALLKDTCAALRVLEAQRLARHPQGLQADSLVEAQCVSALEDSQVLMDKVWESNQNVGMMRVGFWPQTAKRRSTFITTQMSCFSNLHTEEAMSRLANREFPPWIPEVEHLCFLIDELTRGASMPALTSYMRLNLGGRANILVKFTRFHTRDHLNRVIQSQFICEPVTLEAWDEAALRTPHLVRPLMMAAGDTRNGAALLADLQADMERMRVDNLNKTEEGSAFLRRLLKIAWQKLAPICAAAEEVKSKAAATVHNSKVRIEVRME